MSTQPPSPLLIPPARTPGKGSRPHTVCFLPLLLFGSWRNFYVFTLPDLSTFSFCSSRVYVLFTKGFSIPVLLKYPPVLSSKSCRGSLLLCNFLIHLEFMFVCGARRDQSFIFQWIPHCPNTMIYLHSVFPPLVWDSTLILRFRASTCVCLSRVPLLFHESVCLFLCQYCTVFIAPAPCSKLAFGPREKWGCPENHEHTPPVRLIYMSLPPRLPFIPTRTPVHRLQGEDPEVQRVLRKSPTSCRTLKTIQAGPTPSTCP